MKKILVVANSFGDDGNRYLYGIARGQKEKETIKLVTLYIGGCSLYRHYRNWFADAREYDYVLDGVYTGLKCSIKEALVSDEWDVIVTQQSSLIAGDYETYTPFIGKLTEVFREYAPKAKLYLQMTWSYSDDSGSFRSTRFSGRADMIDAVIETYERVARENGYDGIIPSMFTMNKLYEAIGGRAYRDKHHVSLGLGRYALGLTWYMTLWGKSVEGNRYRDFDEPVSEDEVALAMKLATEAVTEYGIKLS